MELLILLTLAFCLYLAFKFTYYFIKWSMILIGIFVILIGVFFFIGFGSIYIFLDPELQSLIKSFISGLFHL